MMIAGNVSEQQTDCSPVGGGFPVTNASGATVLSIDKSGNLCTVGNVT
jgi:hypothetical protein